MDIQKKTKKPMSQEGIFKIMICVTYVVSSVFLLKNLLGKNMQGALVIGLTVLAFTAIILFMKARNLATVTKEFVVSIALVFVVFVISLYSGECYSDDFPMMLAIVGMTGLYMQPKFTRIQIVIMDIAFVLMYLIHPDHAESLSQYIMCMAIFTLAAWLFSLTIKRGRAFIEISEERAKAAEELLLSMNVMGEELQRDFESSSESIDESTHELESGSDTIMRGARAMAECCEEVHDKIQITGQQIDALDEEVKGVEVVLTENRSNIGEMTKQIELVKQTMKEANEVFGAMQAKMRDIAKVSKQLSDISFNTTILSLNASIEAAKAGDAGAGFEVVAGEVRKLSEDSNECSEKVSDIVKELHEQVDSTAVQFEDSYNALAASVETMNTLQESFVRLTESFESLYGNIEAQNSNVSQVDNIFAQLNERVMEMSISSEANQEAVAAIIEAMDIYKVNITKVINDTKQAQLASE